MKHLYIIYMAVVLIVLWRHDAHATTHEDSTAFCYGNFAILQKQNPDSASVYAEHLHRLTKGQDIPQKIIEAYEFLADRYEKITFEFSKAIAIQGDIAAWAEKADDSERLISAYAAIARLYVEIARYDKAYRFADKALKISTKSKSTSWISDIYNTLGKINYYCEDYDTALEYFNKIGELPSNKGNNYSKVLALNNSVAMYSDTAYIQKQMNEAIRICKQENFMDNLAMVYDNLCVIYINKGDLDKARYYHELCGEVPKSLEKQLNYHRSSGILEIENGDFNKARKNLEEALALSMQGEFERKQADLLYLLTFVYANLNEYGMAYESLYRYMELNGKLSKSQILRELFKTQQDAEMQGIRQKRNLAIAIGLIIVIALFGTVYHIHNEKVRRLQQRAMKLENEQIRKEKQEQEERLRFEIREQNIKKQNDILSIKRVQQYQQEVLINDIIDKLKAINAKLGQKRLGMEIFNIINDLEHSKDNMMWEEMEQYLSETSSEFYENLLADFPDLTVNERRLCAFLHMNMTTKEISMVTRKSINSITTARSRLRTKFNIKGDDQSLITFLDKYANRPSEENKKQSSDTQQITE